MTPILSKSQEPAPKLAAWTRPAEPPQESYGWKIVVVVLLLASSAFVLYRPNQARAILAQIKDYVAGVQQAGSNGKTGDAAPHNTADQTGAKDADTTAATGASGATSASGNPASADASAPVQTSGNSSGTDGAQSPTLTPLPVKMQPVMRDKPSVDTPGTSAAQTTPNKSDDDTSTGASDDSEPSAEDAKAPSTTTAPEKPTAGTGVDGGASRTDRPLVVDGFTRRDVPDLLRQAEVAAQRNDYRLARYEYNLVLRLEPRNFRARQGLRQLPLSDQAH